MNEIYYLAIGIPVCLLSFWATYYKTKIIQKYINSTETVNTNNNNIV